MEKAEKCVLLQISCEPDSLIVHFRRLIDEGGDWDRRNRLKVYQALHFISIRQFKRAADLFLDALSTFTATEVISFADFVAMAVISGALTLGRVDLKKKVRVLSRFLPLCLVIG